MSVSPYHSKTTGNDAVHPAFYFGTSDPASPDVSVTADDKIWVDQTTGTTLANGWIMKIRASSNTVWTTILDLATSLGLKANLASPALSGTPTAPTAAPGTNTTQIATTAFATAAAAGVSYTDEQAQDAVGTILTDSATVDFTYNDGANTITAIVIDDSITYAKIQNVSATDKVLGRSTAGAGDVEEIVCTAAGRALIDDASNSVQRTTLGLAIGTDVQAYSLKLTTIAANTVSTQSGTTYTAVLGDADTYIQFTNGSAIVFTIPPNGTVAFPVGTLISYEQNGAGVITATAGVGVTLNSRAAAVASAGQYAVVQLKKVATNIWTIAGDVA